MTDIFETFTGWSLSCKAGLCLLVCVHHGTLFHGRGSDGLNFSLVGDCAHLLCLVVYWSQGKEVVIGGHSISKSFDSFASLKIRFSVLVVHLYQLCHWNLMEDGVSHDFVKHGTDYPLRYGSSIIEEMQQSFFKDVGKNRQCRLKLETEVISDPLMDLGRSRPVGVPWEGSKLHSSVVNSSKLRFASSGSLVLRTMSYRLLEAASNFALPGMLLSQCFVRGRNSQDAFYVKVGWHVFWQQTCQP